MPFSLLEKNSFESITFFNKTQYIKLNVLLADWYDIKLIEDNIMLHLPNGLSVDQLKKYAKRLKKEENISLIEAQNKIAQEYSEESSWKNMIKYIKNENIFSFQSINNSYQVFHLEDKPLLFIFNAPGKGTHQVIKGLINNHLTDYDSNVLYLNFSNSPWELNIFEDNNRFIHLNLIFSDNKSYMENRELKEETFDYIINSINSKTGIIIIEDYLCSNIKEDSENLVNFLSMCKLKNIKVIFSSMWVNELFYKSTRHFVGHYLFLGSDYLLSLFDHDFLFIEFDTGVYEEGVRDILSFNPSSNQYKKISFKIKDITLKKHSDENKIFNQIKSNYFKN